MVGGFDENIAAVCERRNLALRKLFSEAYGHVRIGTADQLKERTGGTYCEIVPRHIADLPEVVRVLGPLLPQANRAALTETSDRISMPAPEGPRTLMAALTKLNEADIELMDIALRRPSLDEVFLALTGDHARGAGERTEAPAAGAYA